MRVEKEKFDELLGKMLKQKPERTSAIRGKPGNLHPTSAVEDRFALMPFFCVYN